MSSRLQTLLGPSGFSIGLEMPLDNDWSSDGQRRARADGRPFGVTDLKHHAAMARLADQLGFRALWVRDVPLYDPAFGDAGQVFEAFSYLGYLAGITHDILLGTAAMVLPLREPLLFVKAVNSIDHLSNGRLLLGVASGDRAVEYPIFGKDYDSRGAAFRDAVQTLREQAHERLPEGIQLLPHATSTVPLLVAGLAQQSPAWVGQHMDGWLSYPGMPQEHVRRVGLRREVGGSKPYITVLQLDLDADPAAPLHRMRMGIRGGRNALLDELQALQAVGVQHVSLHLRLSERPVADVLKEVAQHILPRFHLS